MPKYHNGVIYKLKHNEDYDDENIYVGSTTNFKNRKYCHKKNCNNVNDKNHNIPVYKYIRDNGGWAEWIMIPIEPYSCNDKKELEIKERYYIDLFKPTLNKNIPTRPIKEWREDNKEKNYIKKKKYYEANKEIINEKLKKYREANKEQLYKNAKEKVICDHCGCEISKGNLKRHQQSNKCINFKKD
jgi:hypothetical protein